MTFERLSDGMIRVSTALIVIDAGICQYDDTSNRLTLGAWVIVTRLFAGPPFDDSITEPYEYRETTTGELQVFRLSSNDRAAFMEFEKLERGVLDQALTTCLLGTGAAERLRNGPWDNPPITSGDHDV